MIMKNEKPELEKEIEHLRLSECQLRTDITELEKKILDELASSTGSISDNTELITSLQASKEQSCKSKEILKSFKIKKEQIENETKAFKTLAHKY